MDKVENINVLTQIQLKKRNFEIHNLEPPISTRDFDPHPKKLGVWKRQRVKLLENKTIRVLNGKWDVWDSEHQVGWIIHSAFLLPLTTLVCFLIISFPSLVSVPCNWQTVAHTASVCRPVVFHDFNSLRIHYFLSHPFLTFSGAKSWIDCPTVQIPLLFFSFLFHSFMVFLLSFSVILHFLFHWIHPGIILIQTTQCSVVIGCHIRPAPSFVFFSVLFRIYVSIERD